MSMEKSFNPIVSVIVCTYNSSKYVVETLNSIKEQTYKNIELLVTDDCSTDDTITICANWIENAKDRFIQTTILTVQKNTGIPSNCNRGIKAAQGAWIKLIAGDDLLLSDTVQKNVEFALRNDADVLFSKRITFKGNAKQPTVIEVSRESIFNEPLITANHQYQLTLRSIGCPPNTLFYRKSVFEKVDYFDEDFRLIEDWPMNMRMTKAGFKISYMPEETFLYRVNDESVFHSNSQNVIYNNWGFTSVLPVFKKYVFPNVGFWERFFIRYEFFIKRIVYKTPLNKRNLFTRAVNYALLIPSNLYRNHIIKILKIQIIREIGGKDQLKYSKSLN